MTAPLGVEPVHWPFRPISRQGGVVPRLTVHCVRMQRISKDGDLYTCSHEGEVAEMQGFFYIDG